MDEVAEEDIDRLILAAYDAGYDPSLWDVFCAEVDRVLDCAYVSIHAHDLRANQNAGAYSTRHPSEFIDSYQAYYAGLNPIVPLLLKSEIGKPIRTEDLIAMDELLATEFYNDWMRPQERVADGAGMVLFRSPERLLTFGAQIRLDERDWKVPQLMTLLRRVGPHVRRAFHIQRSLSVGQFATESLLTVMEMTENAVLMLDGSGHPHQINAAANALFNSGFLKLTSGGGLSCADGSIESFIVLALEAIKRGNHDALQDGCPVSLPEGGEAVLRVVPLSRPERPIAAMMNLATPIAMLTIARRPRTAAIAAAALGLTRAEIRLAVSLSEGETLSSYALARGVSVHTARNQLKSIFEKTGTNSQSQLVALLMTRA